MLLLVTRIRLGYKMIRFICLALSSGAAYDTPKQTNQRDFKIPRKSTPFLGELKYNSFKCISISDC